MPTEEEPYAEAELSLLTKEKLGNLVKRQQERWPSNKLRFNLSKLRIDQLRDELLDPKNGFSKAKASNPPVITVLPAAAPSASALVPAMSQPDAAAEAHPTDPPPLDVEPSFRHDAEEPQAAEGSTFNQEEPLKTAIQLFLDDHRVDPVRKSAVWVHIEKHHITVDRRLVNARAVISELQKSYSALRGPVQLAYPCPQDNSYLEYFIRSTHGMLEDGEFNPSALPISPTLSIRIHVEAAHLCDAAMPANTSNTSPGARDMNETPQENSERDALSSWLHDKLLARPDYDFFASSKRRALQNPDIIRVWQFVSSFHTEYYNSKATPSHKRVTKAIIHTTLGIGETWLNDALTGHRLAASYGTNKTLPSWSPEVEAELERVRETPRGREELLKYLKNWDAAHHK